MNSLRTTEIECVILTVFESVATFLRNAALTGIRAHHAKTLEQADFLLMATGSTVLVSDIAIVDCSWHSAANMVSDHHPLVTMLVIADPVDCPYLENALSLGVCGIIWRPIQFQIARKLIRTAHQASMDRRFLKEAMSNRSATTRTA
jgi:DNA-binding NarL/FixJ family response regulator